MPNCIRPAEVARMGHGIGDLLPGQSIELPLPPIFLGRRIEYQRIQRDAHALFGAGNYRMRAVGCVVTITRLERMTNG